MDNKYPSFLWYESLNSSHKNNANGEKRNAKTIVIYNGQRNFVDSLFFVISPIYSIKYIIYHMTILIIHKVFLSFCIFVPIITLSPANLDFWPIPNVEPQHDGDDETND